LLRIW